ncbi:MAG: FHA domain-containing protein [Bacteriovoracaceae bacterium]|nr:FHA domain-containing protein [Bacteriovoracaceae bacterium]
MNLKSLFQRLRLPRKGGKSASKKPGIQVVTQYEIVFVNIENSPRYPLETSLSVGSESGDIVIEDPTLSPKHATFTLEEGVVSVLDHGSQAGTRVGDHELTKGKAVILKGGDELFLGDIQINLEATESQIEVEAEPEEVEETVEEEAEVPAPKAEVIKSNDKMQKRIDEMRLKAKDKPKKKVIVGGGSNKASNLLPRVVGFILDILLSVSLWHMLSPIDEFKLMLEVMPQALQEHVLPQIEILIQENGFGEIYKEGLANFLEIIGDAEKELSLSYILSLFISFRLLTTLLFGQSLGSWLAGVRSFGNPLWKRIGGVLREVLGFFTIFLILPDLPTLFSKRSLKEILTFTHLYNPSKGIVLISWLLFAPIVIVLFFVSPMLPGFEPIFEIPIQEKISKKVPKSEVVAETQSYSSQWFETQFTLDSNNWKLLPRFSWSQDAKGKSLTPTLVFYHQNGAALPILLNGNFEWKKLIELGLSHNPPLQNIFPTLWGFVQGQKIKAASLKYKLSDADKLKFHTELQELIKLSFGLNLSPEYLMEYVQNYGVIFKGLVELRLALLNLIPSGLEGDWSMVKAGKSTLLIYEVSGVKPFDLIIPLVSGKGRVFKVSYASPKEKIKSQKLAKDEIWNHTKWYVDSEMPASGSPMVIDITAHLAMGEDITDQEVEKIFGVFFEASEKIVSLPSEAPLKVATIKSLKNYQEVIQSISRRKNLRTEIKELLKKLESKILELIGHVESMNTAYFAPEEVAPQPAPVQVAPKRKKK